jgi:hypothetical protein
VHNGFIDIQHRGGKLIPFVGHRHIDRSVVLTCTSIDHNMSRSEYPAIRRHDESGASPVSNIDSDYRIRTRFADVDMGDWLWGLLTLQCNTDVQNEQKDLAHKGTSGLK